MPSTAAPTDADPAAEPLTLEPLDDRTVRIVTGSGFRPIGETLTYTWSGDSVREVRIGPLTYHPIERVTDALRGVTEWRPLVR